MNNGDFKVTFDATPLGHGDFLSDTDLEWSQLKFLTPKKISTASDQSCIARAVIGANRSALQLALKGATVDRVTHTRADFHTLFVRMPVGPTVREKKGRACSQVVTGGDLKKFTDSLDLHVTDVAKGKVDEWFNRSMSGDLVEEYYRGSTTSTPSLRFVISGNLSELSLVHGSSVNITVQLVGVQFRSQYFTCVWKIVSLEDATKENENENGFGFFPEDDEDPEEDLDDAYPTEEERIELVRAESMRLSILADEWQSAAEELHVAFTNAVENAQRIRDAIHKLSIADASEFAEAYAEAEHLSSFPISKPQNN